MYQRNFSGAGIELFCGKKRMNFEVVVAVGGEWRAWPIGENDTVHPVISPCRR